MAASDSLDSFLGRVASRLEPVEQSSSGPVSRGIAADPSGSAKAAVVLLLRPNPAAGRAAAPASTQVLFIKRAERDGDPWSGHIAFPGGRREESDLTLLDVAVRETREEVGIDARKDGKILGRLPVIRPLSVRLPPLEVTPFVAAVPGGAVLSLQAEEVADAFWLTLAALLKGGRSTSVRFGERGEFPAYPSPAGPIWGITERILTEFLALAGRDFMPGRGDRG